MPKSSQRCSTNMSHSSNDAFVEQQLEPLARGELALGVLGVDALLAAAEARAARACASSCSMMSCMRRSLVGRSMFETIGQQARAAGAPPPKAASAAGVARRRVSVAAAPRAPRGWCAKALAQAGVDALPHPGARLLAPALGQPRRWPCCCVAEARRPRAQNASTPAPVERAQLAAPAAPCAASLAARVAARACTQAQRRRDLRLRARRGGRVEVGLVDRRPGRPAPSRPS